MSFTAAALNPAPERWGAMRAGNTDTRGRDTSPDLGPLSDTIATATVSIVRRDGVPMGSGDLAWSGTSVIDATRTLVTISLSVGIPFGLTVATPVDYQVTITATTSNGRVLGWDAYQLVVAQIG